MTEAQLGRGQRDDPYRYRQGWSASARLTASQRVREAVQQGSDLLEVAEHTAGIIREILVAARVSFTLMDEVEFRDLVNVGDLYQDQVRFPTHQTYPTSTYPAATARLLAHEGYISTSSGLDVIREYIETSTRPIVGCFMGVPIAAAGEVMGELFALRSPEAPPFLPEDLEVATDFATQFGTRLPALIAARSASDPSW